MADQSRTMFKETFHQTLALLTVFFNAFNGAIGHGWVAPVLYHLRKPDGEFNLTLDQCSWIVSFAHIGKLFGAILSAVLLDRVGRKSLLSLCAAIHLISWLLILFTRSTYILYLVRLSIGLAIGFNDATSGVYLGEISSPFNRAVFGSMKNLFYNMGFLFEFFVASYLSYHSIAIVNSVTEMVFFLAIFLLVEPPHYLFLKHKPEQAEKNFLWLKGVHSSNDFEDELEKIRSNISEEASRKSSYRKLLTYPANYKSISINCVYSILSGFLGYYSIISFAPLVLSATKIITANEFLIILQAFTVIWFLFISCILNRFNRKSTLLLSSSIIGFVHASTAVLFYIQENIIKICYFPWLIFILVTICIAAFPVIYTTTFLIQSELFPISIKPLGNCISIASYSISSFLSTKIFLFISHHYGNHVNFFIFSSASFTMVMFTYIFLPETRNKSLIEIQENF